MKDLAIFVAALLLAVVVTFFLLYTAAPPNAGQNAPAPAMPPVVLPPLVPAQTLPPLIRTTAMPRYRITALPVDFEVSDLNNKGELVGTSEVKETPKNAAFQEHAYLQKRAVVWFNGKRRVLPTFDDANECEGLKINDASLVGGMASFALSGGYTLFQDFVVLWNARAKKITPKFVGSLGELSIATLRGLNARGQAVGWASPGSAFETEDMGTGSEPPKHHAFFWEGKKLLDLGSGYACGLNDRGQVVGLQEGKVVLWQGKEKRLLCDGAGYAINNRGQIVGASDFGRKFKVSYMAPGRPDMNNPNPPPYRETFFYPLTHALLYDKGKPHDLGVLPGQYFSRATALNDRGQIVGVCTRQNEYQYDFDLRQNRAFLWQAGRMTALNALLPKNSGWNLFEVKAINNRGQIVGVGALHGKKRSYLLTPR